MNHAIALRKLNRVTLEKQYVGELGWVHVEHEDALNKLAGAYKDLEIVADLLLEGSSIRTPFAFYRVRHA